MGVVYADTLTFLYEGTARLIEQHTPLVETCYGPDWMPSLVQKLQVQYVHVHVYVASCVTVTVYISPEIVSSCTCTGSSL